ncbi:MAG: tRNA uridine-5-carboxymethylaminomethyl(34) synthesis GTPase MnmE [Actinomycetota bacterium]|nr:tRNA uridine-5-carboxymethylaminomethyl(34) synthesis GTPase MnmE [Actinomycetota bacterium]
MSENDTIVALATKAGNSAINIIKLSGNKSIEITDKIFKSANKKKISKLNTYNIVYGKVYDDKNEVIDEAIVSVMKGPKSYTREDVVEINCHGGIASVNKIIDIILQKGARLAEPGEFTKRAFLNGRIDLSQAEAVIEIINAKNITSLKIAANNLTGNSRKAIKNIREQIVNIISELEVKIDFIEEDLETMPIKKIIKEIQSIEKKIIELIDNEKKSEIIKEGIKIAIVGKPNVGKSSLLNIMTGKEKSIVTHIPGTTRDVVEETLNLDGVPVIFKDTAGIRTSKNIIEQLGVKKSREEIENADIIILILDNSKKISDEDRELLKITDGMKRIILLNKIDLKNKADIEKLDIDNLKRVIKISAKEKIGINKVIKEIKKIALGEDEFLYEEKVIVNKRQRVLLENALVDIENAIKTIKMNYSEEFIITDLKSANSKIAEITGEKTGEEILNKIFSKFCIGK